MVALRHDQICPRLLRADLGGPLLSSRQRSDPGPDLRHARLAQPPHDPRVGEEELLHLGGSRPGPELSPPARRLSLRRSRSPGPPPPHPAGRAAGLAAAPARPPPPRPRPIGLQRWRKADPEFAAALRSAMKYGHKARGRARAAAFCSPRITRRVTRRIVDGASLAALGREPDMPSLFTLYKWVRTRPHLAAAVARACEFRDWMIADQAVAHADRLAADPRAASRVLGAASKTLGQLNPHPGARRRD